MDGERAAWSDAGGGWLRYDNSTVPFNVHIRPALVDGRWVIAELRIGRPEGITGGDLRKLRLDPVEAQLARAVDATGVAEELPDWYRDLQRRRYSLTPRLRAPASRPYPDSFYEDVASSYLACIESGTKPAPLLASYWRVPVTTIHGWVKEARRRGILQPGRKGKAG
jgi:hypothetical protein